MKKINKKLLDALIQETKRYYGRETESNWKRFGLCKKLSAECGVDWLLILNLINAMVAPSGFAENAQEEVIYGALRALGWEVA